MTMIIVNEYKPKENFVSFNVYGYDDNPRPLKKSGTGSTWDYLRSFINKGCKIQFNIKNESQLKEILELN